MIEVVIGILILSFTIIAITNLITTSFVSTRKRLIDECLINAANSAIEACRAGINLSEFNCGGINIKINLNVDCSSISIPNEVWKANCAPVRATVSFKNYEYTIKDLVCKFGGA